MPSKSARRVLARFGRSVEWARMRHVHPPGNRVAGVRDEPTPRDRLIASIAATPGTYFSQLQRATELAQGELAYHLRVLEKAEVIVNVGDGHYKHYFLRNVFPAEHKTMLSVLALPQPRELLLVLTHAPHQTVTQVAQAMRTTPPNVSWHLKRLTRANLVHRTKDGSRVTYASTIDPVLLKTFLENYHPSTWRVWSERLAETIAKISQE